MLIKMILIKYSDTSCTTITEYPAWNFRNYKPQMDFVKPLEELPHEFHIYKCSKQLTGTNWYWQRILIILNQKLHR